MEIKEIMDAVRRMRTYQKRKTSDYSMITARREAEKVVDQMVKEWEMEEFHKRQTQLFK